MLSLTPGMAHPPDGTVYEVVIIGSGFSGIGMAAALKEAGRSDFLLLERADGLGGTWRDNVYPGVSPDVPSPLYCFEKRPNPQWSRLFAPGSEVLDYLRNCAKESGLMPHIMFGAEAQSTVWNDKAQLWNIRHTLGRVSARNLVLACGRLTEPQLPDVPGLESFDGHVVHTARWDEPDLAGKRVALVGTGASAVQVLPHLAAHAKEVTVFQRSAPYVLPRGDREPTLAEREALSAADGNTPEPWLTFFDQSESVHPQRLGRGTEQHDEAIRHLSSVVHDPELRRKLTPQYALGCKRVTFSDYYLPQFLLPHVNLEDSALARVSGSVLIGESGNQYQADEIVCATGFITSEQPYARFIVGSQGQSLAEHWQHAPLTYASTVVSGFPNMYVLNGPHSGLSHNSAIFMIETQIAYAVQAIDYRVESGSPSLEVSAEAEHEYSALIEDTAQGSVWYTPGCHSWYLDPRSHRLSLIWPGSARVFRELFGTFDPTPFFTHRPLAQEVSVAH